MSSAVPTVDEISIRPVSSKAEKKAFIELAYRLNRGDPNWVPELKDEVNGLITPGKNPWFEHAEAAFFLAWRAGRSEPVGRISAQVDHAGAGAYGRRHRPVGHAGGRGRGGRPCSCSPPPKAGCGRRA